MSDSKLFGKKLEPMVETEDRPCKTCGRPVAVAVTHDGDVYCIEHDQVLQKELNDYGI